MITFDVGTITFLIVVGTLVFILVIMIIKSRYKIFTTNYYVIHFRWGKVKKAGLGGSFFLLPIIDEYVMIPTTAQKVDIDAEKVISYENQELIIRGFLVWRVVDPARTFSSIEWVKISPTLKDIAESVIRTTSANMALLDILRKRQEIVNAIISELEQIVADWGIKIETVEIREVDVVNKELLRNLQAQMFWEQWKQAGLLEQQSKLEVGLKEQEREKLVGLKAKEKEMAIAQKEIEVAKLKATREKEVKIIEAEAARQSKVITAEAERTARIKLAEAEAEAKYLKLKKEAEGLKELNKVVTDKIIMYHVVQNLPEALEGLKGMFQNAVFVGSSQDLSNTLTGMAASLLSVVKQLGLSAEKLSAPQVSKEQKVVSESESSS